jgi:hypothetical protein
MGALCVTACVLVVVLWSRFLALHPSLSSTCWSLLRLACGVFAPVDIRGPIVVLGSNSFSRLTFTISFIGSILTGRAHSPTSALTFDPLVLTVAYSNPSVLVAFLGLVLFVGAPFGCAFRSLMRLPSHFVVKYLVLSTPPRLGQCWSFGSRVTNDSSLPSNLGFRPCFESSCLRSSICVNFPTCLVLL